MPKTILHFLLWLAATALGLALAVAGLGRAAWSLSGAGRTDLDRLPQSPRREIPTSQPSHRVEEWPAERGRKFNEAPMLARQARDGKLPPVAQRLPEDPQVVIPPDQNGPYGGTWRRFGTGPEDTFIVNWKISYMGMVRFDQMGRRILPNLAARWTIEDGGRTYTFRLRKGIRWSDGEPFTADDIMFWHEDILQNRDLTPVIPDHWRRSGQLVRIEKLDAYAVRFSFREPHGLLLQSMAHFIDNDMFDRPAHYLKQFHPRYAPKDRLEAAARAKGFDFWYQLFADRHDWRNPECPHLWAWVPKTPPPAQPVVFERNPYYWKVDGEGNQLPYMDRVTYEFLDPEIINQKALSGETGVMERHLNGAYYPLFVERAAQRGYSLYYWPGSHGNGYVLAPNLNSKDPVLRAIFHDRRFRIALSVAINRRELIEVGGFGRGVPRQVCPPRASPYYQFDPVVAEYEKAYTEYDPAGANRLLDEMGLSGRGKDGVRLRPDGRPLVIYLETSRESPLHELIAEYWTAVGVKTEVKLLARQLFYQRKEALMHDVAMWVGADEFAPMLDPRWFFPFSVESLQGIAYARWFHSEGRSGEEPPEDIRRCMDLYRQISRTPDEARQMRLFKEIIELNRKNLWVIGISGEGEGFVLVPDSYRNVPRRALVGSVFRTPGNAFPETWSIVEK